MKNENIKEGDTCWVFVSDVLEIAGTSNPYEPIKVKVEGVSFDGFFACVSSKTGSYSYRCVVKACNLFDKDEYEEVMSSVNFRENDLVLWRNEEFFLVQKENKATIRVLNTISGQKQTVKKKDCIIISRGESKKRKRKVK
jgi:hypothetical protein